MAFCALQLSDILPSYENNEIVIDYNFFYFGDNDNIRW